MLERWNVVQNKHLLRDALDEYFRSRLVLTLNRKQNPPHALWRLSIPLWGLAFVLMAFVVLPVRWLFTGEYKVSHKSRSFGWLRAWHQKLFPWPKP